METMLPQSVPANDVILAKESPSLDRGVSGVTAYPTAGIGSLTKMTFFRDVPGGNTIVTS